MPRISLGNWLAKASSERRGCRLNLSATPKQLFLLLVHIHIDSLFTGKRQTLTTG